MSLGDEVDILRDMGPLTSQIGTVLSFRDGAAHVLVGEHETTGMFTSQELRLVPNEPFDPAILSNLGGSF